MHNIYLDPNEVGSYGSLTGFLKNANIFSKEKAKAELQKLRAYTLHYPPIRKRFNKRRFTIRGYGEIWSIDLADMTKFSRMNSGKKYLLGVVEALSKYAYVIPISNNKASTVKDDMVEIIIRAKYTPKFVNHDLGKEWEGQFKAYMNSLGIKQYSTYSLHSPFVDGSGEHLNIDLWLVLPIQGKRNTSMF